MDLQWVKLVKAAHFWFWLSILRLVSIFFQSCSFDLFQLWVVHLSQRKSIMRVLVSFHGVASCGNTKDTFVCTYVCSKLLARIKINILPLAHYFKTHPLDYLQLFLTCMPFVFCTPQVTMRHTYLHAHTVPRKAAFCATNNDIPSCCHSPTPYLSVLKPPSFCATAATTWTH